MQHTMYHKGVRSCALLLASVLVFQSGLLSSTTRELSRNATLLIGNTVGVFASVPQNEINTLSSELQKRGEELDRREREIDARVRGNTSDQMTTLVLSAILFLLLVLIVINYILDFLRTRRLTMSQVL
jgi:hypothetical protein